METTESWYMYMRHYIQDRCPQSIPLFTFSENIFRGSGRAECSGVAAAAADGSLAT